MKKILQEKYKLIILASLIFTVFVSILNASNDSLIYDEDAHIPAGYSYLTKFDMRLNPEHPPLIKDLSALPLLFLNLKFDTSQKFWDSDPNTAQWNAGSYFLYTGGNNPDQIIFWSRLPIILIFVVLALFIFKWTKELAGIGAGLLAFILFVFDPNILGHNHFVTTDLGIAAFTTFVFYYFIKFLKEPTRKNVLLLALFLTLVQLTKFSSVLIFPVFGLTIIIYSFVKIPRHKKENNFNFKLKTFGEYFGKFVFAFVISIFLVWIGYYFTTFNMPKEKMPEILSYYMYPNDPRPQTIYTRKILLAINDVPVLRPLAMYSFGIARVFQRVGGGNTTYFLQEINKEGFFSYFPIVFLLKTPLLTLILIFSALSIALYNFLQIFKKTSKDTKIEISTRLKNFCRIRITELLMLLFIFVYCFTSVTGRLNIGIRHLFPIFPFIFILISKTIFDFIKELSNKKSKITAYCILVFLCFLLILKTILAYPFYMSYFNEFAGGPKNGYRYVTDSNADWGQDLKRLKIFIDRYNWCPNNSLDSFCKIYDPQKEPIEKIRLDYFGGGYYTNQEDLKYYLGDNYTSWHGDSRPIEPGWYALSVEFLQGSIYDKNQPDSKTYRWLKDIRPFYQVGTSILIYHLTPEDLSKIKDK